LILGAQAFSLGLIPMFLGLADEVIEDIEQGIFWQIDHAPPPSAF
jgi:hypothetical protein